MRGGMGLAIPTRLNKGSHAAYAGDLGLLVGDARALASKIRDGVL